ncbi:MAG: hypothetical protein AAFN10_14670 [Bacteroidota bacterium]
MFTLIQILSYGWPSREERSAKSENQEILFANKNKAYGAYQLRNAEPWYLMTAMGLVLGVGGTLLLAYLWWAPIKQAEAPAANMRVVPICRFFSLPVFPPAAASPNAHPHRQGEGDVKLNKFFFQPPDPSPTVPHYGWGIGHAQGDKLDGWSLPDLPGEDEVIPEVKRSLEGGIIPEVQCVFIIADEAPRPVNLADIKAQIPILNTAYPTRSHLLSCKINKRGEYMAHRWITEVPAYISEQIDPYLAELRFVPKIQDGRPQEAELLISLEIPDLVSDWVRALP